MAEFANIRKQLEVLEDRLDMMVQPRLTDALSNRKVTYIFGQTMVLCPMICVQSLALTFIVVIQVDAAQDLRGILIRIGRFKSLESQYAKVHLKPIKQLWEDFVSRQRANKSANEKNEMERISSGGDFHSASPTISFSSWLPNFYDELLLYLEQEWKWYHY